MRSRSIGPAPRLLGLLLIAALATAARAADPEIVVAAAISLLEPLTRAAEGFEKENLGSVVRLTFGSSGAMASQIRAGAPIDVLVAADERIVDDLGDGDHVDRASRRTIARNRLVVIAAPGFAIDIVDPQDLLGPAVHRIAIPESSVPLGSYARSWLRGQNLLAPLGPRIIPTPHARATLAAADGGNVDLAIVYATDARLARKARVVYEVPEADQPPIGYWAVRVAGSKQPELAERFLTFLEGESVRAILHSAGFATP
jgi:molybdate transport system substrate-binding protein